MPAIGITGGISTGKSTFCQCLREIVPGAKFFDADQAAHELVELDDVRQELLTEFGPEIFSDGNLNRAALRAIIFRDAAKKSALENILHPRIRQQWSVEANKHRQSPDFFFADIPLLYETGGETLCDRVVVVACSADIQRQRIQERATGHRPVAAENVASERGAVATSLCDVTPAEMEAIIKSQMPLEEKIKRADHVVWNDGDLPVLRGQAEKLVELWRQEKWRPLAV
jgi:dephospho-CoA kinase